MNILDILIGLPDLHTENLELKLHEERAKYLVCELKCPFEGSLNQYINFIRKMILKNIIEKGRMEDEKAPMLNFIFTSPQGTEIDLRLCSKEVMSRAKPLLMKILEKEAHGWFPDFREKIISELKARNLGNAELEHEANKRISAEYLRRICAAVSESSELNEIGKGISKLLADQVHVLPLPVLLQVHHHEKNVPVAGDEDVLVLHLDVVELLEGVFEKAGHSSYGAAHLKGLEERCY